MTTTNTPRTECYILNQHGPCVPAGFARDLENELNESRADVGRLKAKLARAIEIAEYIHACGGSFPNSKLPELDTLKATLNPDNQFPDATKMVPQEWWNTKGLRRFVPGESFEDSMKWAYSQGQLS